VGDEQEGGYLRGTGVLGREWTLGLGVVVANQDPKEVMIDILLLTYPKLFWPRVVLWVGEKSRLTKMIPNFESG
jgi:hypothetical protein